MNTQQAYLNRLFLLLAVAVIFGMGLPVRAENWPAWRGPRGNGIAEEKNLPVNWSKTENIRWKVALPERGNSTPVVWEDKIFLTQSLNEDKQRTLMCLNRENGKLLWQKGVPYEEKEQSHRTNPYCSSSPVTDGQRVIAWFGSAGLVCYDLAGNQQWHLELGKQDHMWGYGASPILHNDLCILSFGPGTREFVLAVDKKTGKTVWRIDEPVTEESLISTGGGGNKKGKGSRAKLLRGSWGTPIIVNTGEREELILALPGRVTARDPQTGKELWTCHGLGALVYASPVYGNGVVVAMGGYRSPSLAVKTGGSGDVTATHRLWHKEKSDYRLGSGIVVGEHLYVTNMKSIAQCVELKTGKILWQERLPGTTGKGDTWSSPVLSDGLIYLSNKAGDTHVYEVGPKFKKVATNALGEEINSSIVPHNGELLIRTFDHLWCVGKSAE